MRRLLTAYGTLHFIWIAKSAPAASDVVSSNGTPFANSSDVWASVIANVAPLMALVGERHAKEYMRAMSSLAQITLLSAAPVGILSILISAIRLSGPPFLRRLIGRESERKCDAMVELTPVSVETATPVYSDGLVEISSVVNMSESAFVCAHKTGIKIPSDAIAGFTALWMPRRQGVGEDRDFELILVLRGLHMNLTDVGALVQHFDEASGNPTMLNVNALEASLSFRTCGLSPTQTVAYGRSNLLRARETALGILFVVLMIGIQIIGWRLQSTNPSQLQSLIMGIVGYAERRAGSISNARHSNHRLIEPPRGNTLVVASPARPSMKARKKREEMTCVLSATLIGSYCVYYLGIRVMQWWVSFGSLLILWLAAAVRAILTQVSYEKRGRSSNLGNHWIGLFKTTFTESIQATIATATPQPSGNILFVESNPYRIALKTWSGGQDIVKVSIELTKRFCWNNGCCAEAIELVQCHWTWAVRFRMVVYLPGVIFRAHDTLDYVLEDTISFDHLVRVVLKVLHACMDQQGTIEYYPVSEQRHKLLSHVLSGPVSTTDASVDSVHISEGKLRDMLQKVPLESQYQVVLFPAAMLAAAYERYHYYEKGHAAGHGIELMQSRHVDKLSLGARAEFLPALEQEIDEKELWKGFMQQRTERVLVPEHTLEDAEAAYQVHNKAELHLSSFAAPEQRPGSPSNAGVSQM